MFPKRNWLFIWQTLNPWNKKVVTGFETTDSKFRFSLFVPTEKNSYSSECGNAWIGQDDAWRLLKRERELVVSKANTKVRLNKQTNKGSLCKRQQAPVCSLCVHTGMCNSKDAYERKALALKLLDHCRHLYQPYEPVTMRQIYS